MVKFNADHKITIPSKNRTHFEWIDEDGRIKDINVTTLTDNELFALKNTIKSWYQDQMEVIDNEINNWQPIYCAVCGEEDLAFRGRPFVTWGFRGGRALCPRHTWAFDRYGTPKAQREAEEKEDEKAIAELFG